MSHNGIIEDATGDLLAAGFTDFTNQLAAGQSIRTDVPIPAKVKGSHKNTSFHRWNGAAWEVVFDLDLHKANKKDAIDFKTKTLIGQGFTHSGKQFSLSLNAQANWLGVLTAGAAALLTYPYPVAALDNTYHLTADEAEMITMATAGLIRKGWAVGSGAALKKAVEDATDQAGVDAVVDTR